MFNPVYFVTIALALSLTQVGHALPQIASGSPTMSPASPRSVGPSSSISIAFTTLASMAAPSPSVLSSSSGPPASPSSLPPFSSPSGPSPGMTVTPSQPGASAPTVGPVPATFDTTFDNENGTLKRVTCSNGPNGLAQEFPLFGDIPSFPFIGGAFDIVWNSPNCGSCWNITNPATGMSIPMTAIDTSDVGFNIGSEAFEELNGGIIGLGMIDVIATKVPSSLCGL